MLVILKVHKHSRTGVGRWDQQGSVKHRLKSGADGSTPATASYVSVRPSVRTGIRFFIKLKATDWRSCGGWTANQRYRPVLCMHANTEILYLLKLLTVLAFFRVKSEDRNEQLSRSIRLKNLQTCIYFTWSPTNKTSTTSRSPATWTSSLWSRNACVQRKDELHLQACVQHPYNHVRRKPPIDQSIRRLLHCKMLLVAETIRIKFF